MEFLKVLLEEIRKMDKKQLAKIIIIIAVLILILIPYIDANFFYPNRIKNRIYILQEITKLDTEKIKANESLSKEYANILKEVESSDQKYINKLFNNNGNEYFTEKFISGGFLWWALGVMMLFFYNKITKNKNGKKNWGTRIAGFVLCAVVGIFIGLICTIIPTIGNIWVNYICVPIVVLILTILILSKSNK